MFNFLPLLAILPAVLGAPAPQAAAATTIDTAVYSSLSSSISSSLSTSLSKSLACRAATSTSTAKSSTSKAATSISKSTSKSATSSKASTSSTRPSTTSARSSSTSASKSSTSLTPSQSTSWWKPTKANTFLYEADNIAIQAPTVTTNTGLKLTKDVYIVDMEGHSAAQIKAYKDKGKRVVCYLSAGSWEPFRDDKLAFSPACYCGVGEPFDETTGKCKTTKNRMDGWDEWWLDIKTPSCLANIKPIMSARMAAAKLKGCDAVDPDNMDSYTNEVSYNPSKQNQVDYLLWFAQEAHAKGLGIGLKNAGELLSSWEGVATQWQKSLVANFDFSVIEACTQYKECHVYDSMLAAGKPQIRVEYESRVKQCPAKVEGVTFSVYSSYVLNTKHINLDC